MTKIVLTNTLILFVLASTVTAQIPPKLDSSYLKKEYNDFVESLKHPKEKLLSIYFSTGITRSYIHVNESFGGNDFGASKEYLALNAQIVNIGTILPLKSKLEFLAGLAYSRNRYGMSYNIISDISYELIEEISLITLPVGIRYLPFDFKLNPFAKLGLAFSHISQDELSGNRFGGQPYTLLNNNMLKMRNRKLFFMSLGLGLNYKLNYGYLFLEANYNKGFSELVLQSKRFSNDKLIFDVGIIESSKSLNYLDIVFGYVFAVFKKI